MNNPNKINILWTNDNVITSEKMVLMYATNSMINNWWSEVAVLAWGATTKLIADNQLIQEKIKMAMHIGVKFIACKACADQLEVTEKLVELGIDVKYVGDYFTDIIKEGEHLITI